MNGSITSPLVSIGLPVYNGEKTIYEAFESLLSQDFKDFELIISDNASTDNTVEICKLYAKLDTRVRYYRNETNIGAIANFNRLVHLARGKYFMWAADDDLWEKSYISNMVVALEKNQSAVLSFCIFDYIYEDKKPILNNDIWFKKEVFNNKFYRLLYSCSLGERVANSCYIYGLIKKDIPLKCGGMEERVDVNCGADIVTLFHLLSYGEFIKVDKLLYHKRYNSDRLFKESFTQRLKEKSFYSLLTAYIKWLTMMHKHYHIMRIIVRKTPLEFSQKVILFITLYMAELIYYFNNMKQTLKNIIADSL